MATLNDVITKLNEAKVAKAGDTMTGGIQYDKISAGLRWITDNGDIFHLRPYSPGNIFQITKTRNGTEWGALNLHMDGSFDLTAYNAEEGQSQHILRGTTDGRLLWRDQNMIFVKESWVSGTSWYRVWSDGYIEQGGKLTPASDGQNVTLYKGYSTDTYGVQATNCDSANHKGAQGWVVSTTVVKIRATAGTGTTGTPVNWYTYGY